MLTETDLFNLSSAERFAGRLSKRLEMGLGSYTEVQARDHIRRLARLLRDIDQMSRDLSEPEDDPT